MGKSAPESSELVEAARRFEDELEQFAKLTRAIEKEPLSSRKSIDRAGTALGKIADIEARLTPAMTNLLSALNALRARHEQQAGIVTRRAEEIRERTEVYRTLVERLAAMVGRSGEINERLTRISGIERDKEELVAELDGVLEQIGELTGSIEALQRECKELRFEDVARQADGLAGELGGARSKLARLRKQLSK